MLESKITDLKNKCSEFETIEFLTFIAGVLLQIETRDENPLFKKLMSPMRQLFYLGFLNTQKISKKNRKGFSEKEWDEMAELLHEIEMEYFYLLGFPNKGNETQEVLDKILVTMPTFMNYYFNGPLSYQEQEIERIEEIFIDFEPFLEKKYQLKISDFITFFDLTNDTINENLNKALKFANPIKWQEFTKKCIEKGIEDPKDWIKEAPEDINAYLRFRENPGSFLILDLNKINYKKISKEKYLNILEIFTFKIKQKKEITYYTEDNLLMSKPIIKISDNKYLPFYLKQYLNATYKFLFNFCSEIDKDKILTKRDVFIEKKVFQLFNDFFGTKGHVYSNYSLDNNISEQDILVLYKNFALIIEVKAGFHRAPMRDANNAYKKLKSDFKKIIQNGYDQTLRVKEYFYENETLKIINKKRQLLYELKTNKYRNHLYSIIVTLDRFGHIQTNLEDMLVIDDEDNYPWSVNIDDLEAFLLTLSKRRNRISDFLNFLMHRENFHGHLLCGDELELCGMYLDNKKKFNKGSLSNDTIATMADLTAPIEKSYSNGMGFKNERLLKEKKDKSVGKLYEKKK